MVDANQIWDVDQAIEWMKELARFNPWWIEEPTSPDDVLGHAKIARAVAPIGVATGEACQNRVIFKQLCKPKRSAFARSTVAGWPA
jgi:L-fuconate dehydratase